MTKYKLHKGILIAIEGVDGAGKTTQALLLKEHFTRKGFKVSNFKEPTDGEWGQKIKMLSKFGRHTVSPEEEFQYFLNDRIEDIEQNIRPALERNEIVIIDRYYFSSIAYQGALGLDEEYILKENEKIAVKPDVVIILDCAVSIGLSRISNFRNEEPNHFEKEDYLEKVRKNFKRMESSYIQIINGSPDEDTVFKNILNIARDIIAPHKQKVIDQLDIFALNKDKDDVIFHKN